MKIAELVKNKRLEIKETQSEFGKRFNLSHAAISDMERGVTTSINEQMLGFCLKPKCEHKKKEYREITIVKCMVCGLEEAETWEL